MLERFESVVSDKLPSDRRVHLGELLLECQAFDHFLAKKFPTLKRYGAEGAESMMGFFHHILEMAGEGTRVEQAHTVP